MKKFFLFCLAIISFVLASCGGEEAPTTTTPTTTPAISQTTSTNPATTTLAPVTTTPAPTTTPDPTTTPTPTTTTTTVVTTAPVEEGLFVYYFNKNNWKEVSAYAWNGADKNADWPGEAMTAVTDHEGWYKIKLDENLNNIIFNNNGNGSQTTDLIINPQALYFNGDEWQAAFEKEEPVVEKQTIYFFNKNNWTTVNAYAWNDSSKNADWPGEAMAAVTGHDGWFSIEINNDLTSIIFNDGTNQTGNLTINSQTLYYNGEEWQNDFEKEEEKLEVFFFNKDNWTIVNAYAWTESNKNADWPGEAMTAVTGHDGWFKIELNAELTSIIFNDGTNQTGNLTINSQTLYYNGEEWQVSFEKETVETTMKIYFFNKDNWTTVSAYAWEGANKNADWPGVAMSEVQNHTGWYMVEIDKSFSSIIFNDGGNGAQTDDFTINPQTLYYNGEVWQDDFWDSSTLTTINIYVVGDSTVCSFNDAYFYPRYGYGTQIDKYLDKVTVHNLAMSGRSSKSFLTEANYNTLKNSLSAGDYLFIGFGHNDEKSDDAARFTDATLPTNNPASFKYSLYENYVKLALEKGAIPVLLSPIVRYSSTDTYTGSTAHITSTGDYRKAIQELAEEKGVFFIDLTTITKNEYVALGHEEAKYYHAVTAGASADEPNFASLDATHINIYGASFVAYSISQELKKFDDVIRAHVVKNATKPTKADTLVKNPNYVFVEYKPIDLTTYAPGASFATTTAGWYGTAFGDTGGAPAGKGFIAKEVETGVYNVGNETAAGKITASSEGFALLFRQVAMSRNSKVTATVKIKNVIAATSQIAFGVTIRDDCYAPVKDSSIISNSASLGIVGNKLLYGRENTQLQQGDSVTAYAANDVITFEIERLGQVITAKMVYKGQTYTKTFTDFDISAIDSGFYYVGFFATRGTVIEVTNLTFEDTGEAMGA